MKLTIKALSFVLLLVFLSILLPASLCGANVTEAPDIKFYINGNNIALSNVPIISNNRTLLPLREILVSLGVPNDDQHIIWNGAQQSVTVNSNNTTVVLKVTDVNAVVNGANTVMDVPPVNYNSRVYIPVRFVSQALGFSIVWNESTKSVYASKGSDSTSIRKGLFDKNAAVPVKRALLVGFGSNSLKDTSNNTYSYYFELNDMLSRGIPFHLSTYTAFVNSYNTSDWLNKYDIIVFYGKYIPEDTVAPQNVKEAVQDIVKNKKYKVIQIGSNGMEREGAAPAYWYSDLGLNVKKSGDVNKNDFISPVTVTGNPSILAEGNASHLYVGNNKNAYGKNLIRLAYAQGSEDNWFASADKDKRWVFVSNNDPQFNTDFGERYNTALDTGKLIWYLRGISSHFAFNRINANKYIAYGFDCDRTNSTQAIDYIREIVGNRPLELGLVASKLDSGLAAYYKGLQSQGVSFVSHTYSHPSGTLTTDEFTNSIDTLNAFGIKNDGIVYTTGKLNDYAQLKPVVDLGYLLCGHLQSYAGRGCAQIPLGDVNILKCSTQLGGAPLVSMSCSDDIFTMTTFQDKASDRLKGVFYLANMEPYDIPLIFYFHDSMLDISFNQAEMRDDNYYNNTFGIERRKQYYKDAFSFLDTLGYTYIKRSQANQLITDINNGVAITSENIESSGVTTRIAATKAIKGLTVAVPISPDKTIASVRVGNSPIGNYLLSTDKSWVYVPVDTEAGKEYSISVAY